MFQSTRPRGTRLNEHPESRGSICFNPRVRAGRDLSGWDTEALNLVSIHASARDATKFGVAIHVQFDVSIHASARDATWFPRGHPAPVWCFNPRVRAGRDTAARWAAIVRIVSIHASARDATCQSG